MKILILGGTGAIGKHLTKYLANCRNVQVYVTSRSKREDDGNTHFFRGNAKDQHFLKEILSCKWDAIVDFMNYQVEEFRNSVNLLLNSTDCYFFLSSSRVYADSGHKSLSESSPLLRDTAKEQDYLSSGEYALQKAEEEIILRRSGRNNWVIFRPYIIYSESRLQLGALEKEDWLYRVLQGKSIVLQKSLLDKKTTLTYSVDAAEVMGAIILDNKHRAKTFNIAGPECQCSASWGEILECYKKILENKLKRKVDVILLDDNQAQLFRKGKYYFQTSHDRMFDRTFDITSIRGYKSMDSFLPISKGLEICVSLFLDNPKFIFTNQAQEAMLDRFAGETSNVGDIYGLKQKLIYLYYRYIKKY